MSLYNMLFGSNPHADALLGILGLDRGDVGRFRDCFLTEDGRIAVYTRNGGGNREEYQHVFDSLSSHPQHISDSDDDFDCTYATIWFSVPDEAKALVEFLKSVGGSAENPSSRWDKLISDMRSGDKENPNVQRALAVGEKIVQPIIDSLKNQENSK